MARIADRDGGAIEDLYAQMGASVFGVSLQVTADHGVAGTITAEVFDHAWQNPHELADLQPAGVAADSLRNRLVCLAHQRATAWVRTHPGRGNHDADIVPVWPSEADVPDRTELRAARTAAIQLQAAYAALPQQERAALYAVYFDGQPIEEAAHYLGLTPSTLRQRLSSALRRLDSNLPTADPA